MGNDYRIAFKAACADLGAISALLGFEAYPGVDALLRSITELLAAHNAGAQEPIRWLVADKIYGTESIFENESDALEFKQARYTITPLYAHPQPMTDAARDALVKRIERHRLDINRGDTVFRCGVNAGLDLVLHELRAAEIERGEREGE